MIVVLYARLLELLRLLDVIVVLKSRLLLKLEDVTVVLKIRLLELGEIVVLKAGMVLESATLLLEVPTEFAHT